MTENTKMPIFARLARMSPAHKGVLIGSASVFLSFLGATLTFPFLQSQRDKFGCDALCYGSMQSTRSGLSMVGNVLIGRLSDQLGRAQVLWIGVAASVLSYMINLYGQSITAIWLSIIPAALLNQNFGVLKALFADYSSEYGFSEAERASAVGKLGMVIGVAFMLGPVMGASCFATYEQASTAAICLCLISGLGFYYLPVPNQFKKSNSQGDLCSEINNSDKYNDDGDNRAKEDSQQKGARPENAGSSYFKVIALCQRMTRKVVGFFYLPALQTAGAKLLLFMRCGMALAFNVFMTVWTVSLKNRFDFGPKGHAYFMGWIGLWYALSQGFISRECIRLAGNKPTGLILLCMVTLSLGRVAAMLTSSLTVVYALMAAVVIALGLMNTIMASACSHLAGRDQVGGLYGVMESVESVTGLFGPTIGGLLFRWNPSLPIAGVVLIYAIIFLVVFVFYDKHIAGTSSCDDASSSGKEASKSNDVCELPSGADDDSVTATTTTAASTTASSVDESTTGDGEQQSYPTHEEDSTEEEGEEEEEEKEDDSNSTGSSTASDDSALEALARNTVTSAATATATAAVVSSGSSNRDAPSSPDAVAALRHSSQDLQYTLRSAQLLNRTPDTGAGTGSRAQRRQQQQQHQILEQQQPRQSQEPKKMV